MMIAQTSHGMKNSTLPPTNPTPTAPLTATSSAGNPSPIASSAGSSIHAKSSPRPRQFCGVPGCGKSFDRPAKLEAHQRTHTGERPFACSQCGQAFANVKHLRVHELYHLPANRRPFRCPHCSKGHVSKQQHERHLLTHVRRKWVCECGLEFVQHRSYTTHVAKHRRCENCGRLCKHERELERHRETQHSLRFHCSLCPERFTSARELREHSLNTHEALKKMPEEVPAAVAALVGLAYETRKLSCPNGCGRRFKRQYDLDRHVKQHLNEASSESSGSASDEPSE